MRISWLLAALLLSAALLALQVWALADYLYWRYEWFDVLMHFLGGLALGAFVVPLLHARRPIVFIALMACVFIGWEVFEYVIGPVREANYVFDTALDILMGTLGACVVYIAARLSVWRSA